MPRQQELTRKRIILPHQPHQLIIIFIRHILYGDPPGASIASSTQHSNHRNRLICTYTAVQQNSRYVHGCTSVMHVHGNTCVHGCVCGAPALSRLIFQYSRHTYRAGFGDASSCPSCVVNSHGFIETARCSE